MMIKQVAVIGTGTMGSQIGITCAGGGFDTIMVDTTAANIERGMGVVRAFLAGQEKKGNPFSNRKAAALQRYSYVEHCNG